MKTHELKLLIRFITAIANNLIRVRDKKETLRFLQSEDVRTLVDFIEAITKRDFDCVRENLSRIKSVIQNLDIQNNIKNLLDEENYKLLKTIEISPKIKNSIKIAKILFIIKNPERFTKNLEVLYKYENN